MPEQHIAYLALGSNLGDRAGHLHNALAALAAFAHVEATSFLYETPPAYVTDQPDFLNAACRITTALGPHELLAALKRTERELGRTPTIRFGPRVIDLDILLYDDAVIDSPDLVIPHLRIAERHFVLQPLCDLAPDLRHPTLGLPLRELKVRLDAQNPTDPLPRVLPLRDKLWAWGRRTVIMGILNVTPDSFSDDGLGASGAPTVTAARAQAQAMQAAGADWIDVGGQSTRPGHTLVSVEEEIARVVPAIEALAAAGLGPISVDTFRRPVAEAALDAGAALINSVWGLAFDPGLAELAVQRGAPLVLLHNRSRVTDPAYPAHLRAVEPLGEDEDAVAIVGAELAAQLQAAQDAGVPRWRLIADPGMGFGKSVAQHMALIRRLDAVKTLAGNPWAPLLFGASRKGFIGKALAGPSGDSLPPDQRLEGTLAACVLAVERGADILRVHDVQAVARAVRFAEATLAG